jgi:hypothetical protein
MFYGGIAWLCAGGWLAGQEQESSIEWTSGRLTDWPPTALLLTAALTR